MKLFYRTLTLILLFGIHFPAFANMASPARPGALHGEPSGLEKIKISREELVIDLRPLLNAEKTLVEATYFLENSGAEKELNLVFAFATLGVESFQVWLDEKEIAINQINVAELPSSWKAPQTTPALQPQQELEYQYFRLEEKKMSGFTVKIGAGKHVLKARYKSDAASNRRGEPAKYWQFAYVLAPAREWASFGGLNVTVHLPKGWNYAANVELTRSGDSLLGSFGNVPVDALAMTLQMPEPRWYQALSNFYLGLFLLAIPLGLIGIGWLSFSQKTLPGRRWWKGIVASIGWALTNLLTGFLALYGADSLIPENQLTAYTYGYAFAVAGLILLAFVALLSGLGMSFLGMRKASKSSNQN
jgi:hypothetical protein